MNSTQNSSPTPSPGIPLPPGFLTVEQIQNLPNDQILSDKDKSKKVSPIHVIGFIKDFQDVIKTRYDFKCALEIKDSSVPEGLCGIKVEIFRKEKDSLPKVHGVADVVLIRNVKAQMRHGVVSLLSNSNSEFHILPTSKIPISPSGSPGNPWESYPSRSKLPTAAETAYVIWANANTKDLGLPSNIEFHAKSMQAMNVKNKFTLLKDVTPGGFYDILGEVIRVYGETPDSATVYLSDYTANSQFYKHEWGEAQTSNGRVGDPYNYLKSRPKATKDMWPGPYGKMTIQLTLWDGHASFVKEQVRVKTWILLRNVQIKYGKSGGYLEGFLRGDRYAIEGKVQVEIMERSEGPDENDSRWKEAVSRKYEVEKRFKQQKQDILDEAAGTKRKREEEPHKGNSRSRRKKRRAASEGKAVARESKALKQQGLNENIRSSNPDEPTIPLADILKPRKIPGQRDSGRQQLSPFHVCKYKANVRVVGYFPPKIEDFAVGRRPSEYDMLSDYSGGEDTDPEGDMQEWKSGKGFPEKNWEWRFALEVIDASNKASNERMWLMVENQDAQMLLDTDATNLRMDVDALREVKEKLCILWGDLEEQKSALARAKAPKAQIPSSFEPNSSPPPSHNPGDQPPIDSDDEDENSRPRGKPQTRSVNASVLSERDSNVKTKGQASANGDQKSSAEPQIKNKGFTCCIKQYGVEVNEMDPSLANAGNGKRWDRKFGLFGTKIV